MARVACNEKALNDCRYRSAASPTVKVALRCVCRLTILIGNMTTATVTYHELPPLATWESDSQLSSASSTIDVSQQSQQQLHHTTAAAPAATTANTITTSATVTVNTGIAANNAINSCSGTIDTTAAAMAASRNCNNNNTLINAPSSLLSTAIVSADSLATSALTTASAAVTAVKPTNTTIAVTQPAIIVNPAINSQQLIINPNAIASYRPDSVAIRGSQSFWSQNNFFTSAQFQQIQSNAASQTIEYRNKKRSVCNVLRSSSLPSSSGITAQTEELCLVCGDKASGYHYNALTCEGCKGFFRRSITRKAVYYCKYGETCDIDMYMRRKCQHCRLKKCMDIGMRPERLRVDSRVPLVVIPEEQCRIKREAKQKVRDTSEQRKSSSPNAVTSTEPLVGALSLETRELINRIVALDLQFATPSNDSIMQLSDYSEVGSSFQSLAELTILSVQLIHQFTMLLPGFSKLSEEDKRTLHKTCKTEVLMLRTARCYDSCEERVVLGNGLKQWRFDRGQYREFIGPLADSIFDFAHSMSKMQLDSAEFSLLTAITIFSDRPGLLQPKAVEDIQEVYTSALQSYVDVQRPKQRTMFARLLMKLTDLRSLAAEQTEIFSELGGSSHVATVQQNIKSGIKYLIPKDLPYQTYTSPAYQSTSPNTYPQ